MKIGLKLPLIMAVIAVSALYLAELISTTNARNTIFEAGQYRLMAVATSRAAEVRSVMESVSADMRAKANNPVILEATRAFVRSWQSTSDAERGAIRRAFVDNNPHPAGEREKLVDAGTGTAYAGVHRYFHEFFPAMLRRAPMTISTSFHPMGASSILSENSVPSAQICVLRVPRARRLEPPLPRPRRARMT